MKTSNKSAKNENSLFNKNQRKEEFNMQNQKLNSKQKFQNKISLKKLKKGNYTMKPSQLFNLPVKSMMIMIILVITGHTLFAQFVKFYDFPPLASSFSRALSIEKETSIADGWSIAGYSNSTSASGSKWLFQKLTPTGSVIYTTLLGEPTTIGSQTCWSHASLTVPADNNVLAGVYKGFMIVDEELMGEGAFTILDASGSPVITKKIAITP